MKIRFVLALAGLLFVCGYGWLAARVYRGALSPEEVRAGPQSYAWILGPPAEELEKAAGQRIQRGLAALNDAGRAPAERLRAYRTELEAAERLLVRSVRAQPAQARALAQLVAAKWELEPPRTPRTVDGYLEILGMASRMAPKRPDVQLQLGELLLSMGRGEESREYLRRSLDLDPTGGGKIVRLLRRNLWNAREILEAFPRSPFVLAAAEGAAFEDGAEPEYLGLMNAALASLASRAPTPLVRAYGSTCLRMDRSAPLRDRLTALGELSDPRAEAERLWQRSRAFRALDDPTSALREARLARELQPDSPQFAERHGRLLLSFGEAEPAILAFRDAIALAARGGGDARLRARLYRRVGQAEETRGNLARAYDAFKMALRLNPVESYAQERVLEMEAAAGRP